MKKKKIIPYHPKLVEKARELRKNSTYSERLLWKYLKDRQLEGFDFDRQKPAPCPKVPLCYSPLSKGEIGVNHAKNSNPSKRLCCPLAALPMRKKPVPS